MSAIPALPPPIPDSKPAASPERTLRRLFLTLFLRGRSSRGLQKQTAPKSIGSKLATTLLLYVLMGMLSFVFLRQPLFALSIYLHAMTLVFLGMFVASSAGEVLFNKEEGDILLHRPVTARALLWAKISVLVQVSLWLAGAFNLAGLFVGLAAFDGGWLFPLAHVVSTALEALFCTACVIMTYQLCLRWFGRERLDALMTTAQVLVAVAAVIGGQLVPQLMGRFSGEMKLNLSSWWIALLPPAWFASFDNAVAGTGSTGSWALAAFGLAVTSTVVWLAFGKLARDYETGLRTLSEARSPRKSHAGRRRWIDVLITLPPVRWWLRDSVSRASFMLTAAYLARDRDVKLRVYPCLAPMLVMPFIFLMQDHGRGRVAGSGFGVAFTGAYMGLIPVLALNLLQYSQQWQAADLFRIAPISGPASLCHGARRAVMLFLTLPGLVFFGLVAWAVRSESSHLALLLPGVIALPVYALLPALGGKSVPLSVPTEEAKSAGRALTMFGVVFVSMALAGIAAWSWSAGWFHWLLIGEAVLAILLYGSLRAVLAKATWPPME